MAEILRFFVRFAPLVFIFLALGALFGFRRLTQARAEMREAVYGLEKEFSQRRISRAVAGLAATGGLAFAEVILVVFLAPNVPALSLVSTPTLNPLTVPTSTLSAPMLATLGATTPNAALPETESDCTIGQIMLTFPRDGAEIRGRVILEGLVNVPNFGFYKYEYAPIDSDVWTSIGVGKEIHSVEEELGRWETSEVTPGDYQLRLVVVDNDTNTFPPCVISVRVLAP